MQVLQEKQNENNYLNNKNNVKQTIAATTTTAQKKQTNNYSNNKKKKKKQARWSLGKDSKGRRISFGFRDENLERTFTTPTRENVTGKYSNSIINNNNNSNDENNQPLSVENAIIDTIDTNDFADIDDNDFEINTPTNNNNNINNRNFTTMKTPNTAMKKQILMSLQEAKEANLYEVLGISKTATSAEIKRAYRRFSFMYHPDKASRNKGVEMVNPNDSTAMFALISKAQSILSNPVERALYDMEEGFQESTEENLEKINQINKENAKLAIELMEEAYNDSYQREKSKNGIIIKEARYGAVPSYVKKDQSIKSQCRHGPTIDVKIPMQIKVNDHSKLYINTNNSKRWLTGFYDPIGEEDLITERRLIVRYKFRGKMHQVIVGDIASLQMPLKAHIYNKKTIIHDRKQRRKNRRMTGTNVDDDSDDDSTNYEKGEEKHVLTEEQMKLKNRRIVMVSLLGFIGSIASLVSFSQSFEKDGSSDE